MKRTIAMIFFVLMLCVFSFAQTAKHVPTVDDIMNMVGVTNPEISPDGKWILYSRSEMDWKANKRNTNLWMLSTETKETYQFTSGEPATQPAWSPDGKWVAFISAREKENKDRVIYVIRTSGGEAVKLFDHKDGISSFKWSPDGKHIFFLANDQKDDASKKSEKDGDDGIFVDEGPNGQSRGQWSNFWVYDMTAKKERQITKEKMIVGGFDVSPDASRIAFAARKENIRNGAHLGEVSVVDVASGTVTQLTNNQAPEGNVKWSPDGKSVSYVAPDDKTYELANGKLYLVDAQTKQYRKISGSHESGIQNYFWSKDGKHIYFSSQAHTNHEFFVLDVASGTTEQLTSKPGVLSVSSLSDDQTKAAATYSNPQQPGDIYLLDVKTNSVTQMTDANPQVKGWALAQSEVIKWKSKDGLEVEGILYYPINYQSGKKAPFILNVHGGPAGVFSYGWGGLYQVYAGLGYASLSPNVRGSSGYSDALLRGNMHDLGGGDYQDLMTGVDYVIQKGVADPDHMGIKGWSYGGILSGWTITQTERFKAASVGAMVTDWASEYAMGFNHDIRLWYIGGTPWDNPDGYKKESSYSFINKVKTPTIILHGESDTTDTIGQSMMFYQGLKDRNIPVRFIRFPREPHGFQEPHHQRIRDVEEISWMQKYVMGVDWSSPPPKDKADKKDDKSTDSKNSN